MQRYELQPFPIAATGDDAERRDAFKDRRQGDTVIDANFDAKSPSGKTTLREKLNRVGAKIVRHGRYVTFQIAEVAVPIVPENPETDR